MLQCKLSSAEWYQKYVEEIEDFEKCIEEKLENEIQLAKACQKKSELDTKLALELKINKELTDQLSELTRRNNDIDRVCVALESRLTISDRDQNRLDNAKELYQVAREITGVRFNFKESTLERAKGYIKSHSRKLLQTFDVTENDSEVLWDLIKATVTGKNDKENVPVNKPSHH